MSNNEKNEQNDVKSENEFFVNPFGIRIKKCCASCKHNKDAVNELTRMCEIGMGIVKPSFSCRNWKLRQGLENAGRGDGNVHRHAFNMYMLDAFNEKNQRISALPQEARLLAKENWPSPEEFAREWEEHHGSRYINI